MGNAAVAAIDALHRHGMYVIGGLIVGNPDDTREAIEANLEFARRYVDYPYIQHPTPYPRTPMARDLAARGLVLHERFEEYDGTTAVPGGALHLRVRLRTRCQALRSTASARGTPQNTRGS